MQRWKSAELNCPNGNAVFSNRYEVEINRRTAAENEFVVLKKVRLGCSCHRKREPFQRSVTVMCIGTLWAAQFLGILTSQILLLRGGPWVLAASRTCKPGILLRSRVSCCISAVAIEFTRVSFCLGTGPFLKHKVKGMKS